jgi:N-acyl-phosphatidylethanolamine-hydrolysing phospholipase D
MALLPIGACEPHWFMNVARMNPAEAVATHRDLKARRSIAMHWGTFHLTDEADVATAEALSAGPAAAGVSADEFLLLPFGGTLSI